MHKVNISFPKGSNGGIEWRDGSKARPKPNKAKLNAIDPCLASESNNVMIWLGQSIPMDLLVATNMTSLFGWLHLFLWLSLVDSACF
jgi:hypothetical protein